VKTSNKSGMCSIISFNKFLTLPCPVLNRWSFSSPRSQTTPHSNLFSSSLILSIHIYHFYTICT
jgi:hypothetical protein